MESRAAGDRADERRLAVPTAAAVALAFLLAVVGAGIAAGAGAGTAADAEAGAAGPAPDDGTSSALAAGDPSASLDTASATGAQSDGPPVGEAFRQEFDPDSVRLTVRVGADGTARWRIEYWTELNDENETAAFEELRDDVAANPDEYAARFANRTNRTVAGAENATGREMSADEFGVDAETRSIPQKYGVLTYTFAWRGFAAVDGDRLRIGDAIGGFYLSDQTRLVVEWPEEYALVEARPEPDERRDRAVLWRGTQTDFVSDEPRVIVDAGGGDGTGDGGTGDGGTGDGGDGAGTGSGPPPLWIGGALALVVLAGGGVAVLRRDRDGDGAADASRDAASGAAASAGTPAGQTGGATGERDDDGAGADEGDESGDDDGPPPELLSNEERVRRLLEAQDGRMRQQEVVAETGWTEAKTSQVVSEMREAGTVETFRLGRENVLKLPDDDRESST